MGEVFSDDLTFIPESTLDDANKADQAQQWADTQRASVAQVWAENARQQASDWWNNIQQTAGNVLQGAGELANNAVDAAADVSDVLTAKPLRQGIVDAIGEQARGSVVGQIVAPYSQEELAQHIEANPASNSIAKALNRYVPASTPEEQERINRLALTGGGLVMGMSGEPVGSASKAGEFLKQAASKALPEGAQPITLTAAEEVDRLRLDKFPEWARDTIQSATESVDWARSQRRGVINNTAADDLADAFADPETGRTIEQWIAGGKAGKAYNTEELRALKNAVLGQAQKVNDLSTTLDAAIKSGDATDRMIADAFSEGEKLQSLVTIFEGGRAEWGRAGHAFQAAARNVASPAENIARIYRKVGGRDNALAAVQEYNQLLQQGANPVQMAQFWSRVEKPPAGFQDWFQLLRFNSMLSGPRTFEINLVGNALEVPWRLARDAGASIARGRPEELAPELAGVWAGLQRGVRPFMETLSKGITTEQALAGDIPQALSSRVRNPVGQKVATALELPGRINAAVDEVSKSVAYSMGLGRQAALAASREGLRGSSWNARVAELMANPNEGMMKAADGIAERMVFKGDMGALGNALGGVQRVPYLGNILIPFLRTVYHITARGIDRSPLGIVGTGIDVARGAYKGGNVPKGAAPLGERLGDNVMGAMAGLGLTGYALSGNITAAGPEDAGQKDLLRSQGWQPYSVKVGDNWVSYSNWGPVAVPFGMAGALAEANLYGKAGDVPGIAMDTFSRFAKLGTEQTYLQGVGAFYKAINDPERYGTSWLTGFMNSLVPFGSAINTLGQATDPNQRQIAKPSDVGLTESLRQSMVSRFPGARQSLQTSQDAFGKPVENIQTGASAFQPFRISPIEKDTTTQALVDAGVSIGSGPKTVNNIPLTPDEQRQFETIAGEQIKSAVEKTLASPVYQRASKDGQKKILQSVVEKAREYASGQILKQIGTPAIKDRLMAARGGR